MSYCFVSKLWLRQNKQKQCEHIPMSNSSIYSCAAWLAPCYDVDDIGAGAGANPAS